jgi:hypothetical protein
LIKEKRNENGNQGHPEDGQDVGQGYDARGHVISKFRGATEDRQALDEEFVAILVWTTAFRRLKSDSG